MALTIQLKNFAAKPSPVPADLIYGANSVDDFNEVKMTIEDLIAAYPPLSSIGSLTTSANQMLYTTGINTYALAPITAFGRSVLALSSAPTVPASSSLAAWDTNKNLSANNYIAGFTSTPSAAGTTVLTVGSTEYQEITGATTQTVQLPVPSTMVAGTPFTIINNSSGAVTVNSSGSNLIQTMASNTQLDLILLINSGTGSASWQSSYIVDGGLAGAVLLAPSGPQTILTYPLNLPGGLYVPTILDAQSETILEFFSTGAGSVNYLSISNNPTGIPVVIQSKGTDANIGLQLKSKGLASIQFYSELSTGSTVFKTGTGNQHQTNFDFSDTNQNRSITWPDADGTVTLLGNSSTGAGNIVLQNSPTIITPIIAQINDTQSEPIMAFSSAGAGSVNYLEIINNTTTNPPALLSNGSDTDVGMVFQTKNSGRYSFNTLASGEAFTFATGTLYQHLTHFTFSNTSAVRNVTWQDADGTVAFLSDLPSSLVASIIGTNLQVIASSPTGDVTLSLPQDIDHTSSPRFNNLTLEGVQIFDANNNIILYLSKTALAVNTMYVGNSALGDPPEIGSVGVDNDLGVIYRTKNAGAHQFISQNTTVPVIWNTGTSAQHTTEWAVPDTAQDRTITLQDASGTMAYLSDITAITPAALTKTDDTNVTLTLGGTPATALLQAASLTLGWTGVLSGPRGGTQRAGDGIITAPAASQSSALSIGAAFQNTLGYDVTLTVYLAVASSTTASILLGVGPTNTPTQQTIVSGLSLLALGIIPVTIYLPTGYYALLSTSGTISVTISGQQIMPV